MGEDGSVLCSAARSPFRHRRPQTVNRNTRKKGRRAISQSIPHPHPLPLLPPSLAAVAAAAYAADAERSRGRRYDGGQREKDEARHGDGLSV